MIPSHREGTVGRTLRDQLKAIDYKSLSPSTISYVDRQDQLNLWVTSRRGEFSKVSLIFEGQDGLTAICTQFLGKEEKMQLMHSLGEWLKMEVNHLDIMVTQKLNCISVGAS